MFIKRTFSLTTNAGGSASGTVKTLPRVARLVGVVTPDGNFDDNYSLSVTDADNRVLFSDETIIEALDAAPTEAVPVGKTPLTVSVTNGGNTQTGTVTLYLEA